MRYYKYYLLSLAVIILDQTVKMLVHFNMELGTAGQIPVFGDWFKLHYTLNPGMAFGLQLGSEYGKLILSIFRLAAMIGIAMYLRVLAKRGVHPGLLWCTALILGGAIGNVIDSTFYGVYLNNAPYDSPTPWFHGQVIDMFYLDIWEGIVPKWIPLIGGEFYSLWPIFNIADASIFVGVAIILIMQKKFFAEKEVNHQETLNENTIADLNN
ncbi:lipoprotein signal peptidase [Rhodocytophaga aerolata]|uniref:Lipoprotein signal peptidase n=1 Tax=Rhodocytophaga aerolata TaxID=455078 RepID=A0ABT8R899_9BACT|nr:lipoprotein signal peptidase [Rhodocytophaga aerolata]MDO1448325.1 lipoprotein signal peptidase [Rhodocytophaga aerolata]